MTGLFLAMLMVVIYMLASVDTVLVSGMGYIGLLGILGVLACFAGETNGRNGRD